MADPPLVTERQGFGLATIMARKGGDAAAIGAAIRLPAPTGPARIGNDVLALIGVGPAAWLAIAEEGGPDWPARIARPLAGLASVSDQSGGYAIFRLSGPAARSLLQRGAAIDLHPDVFGPSAAAATMIAHIGVILWQGDDADSFDVALFRSYATSFRHWIEAAMARP